MSSKGYKPQHQICFISSDPDGLNMEDRDGGLSMRVDMKGGETNKVVSAVEAAIRQEPQSNVLVYHHYEYYLISTHKSCIAKVPVLDLSSNRLRISDYAFPICVDSYFTYKAAKGQCKANSSF